MSSLSKSGNTAVPAPPSGWIAALLVFAYLLVSLVALNLIRSQAAMPAGSELSLPRSVFTVANAASLTGFQQTIPVESYMPFGQVIIFVLMVCGSLVSMIAGGAAVVRIVGLRYTMKQLAAGAVAAEVGAIVIGTAGLWVNSQRDFFESVFQAVSAFGNCGVVIGPASGARDAITQVLILPLSVLGGLGLPVLMELVDRARRREKLSTYALTVLAGTAAVYLIGGGALFWLNWSAHDATTTPPWSGRGALIDASTTSLNSRTLGWPVESPGAWPRAAMWVVLGLMVIGASPAGTGGGLKVTTLAVVGKYTFALLAGRPVNRIFAIAIVWVGLYLLVILLTVMRLLWTEPQLPADQILLIATSATGNVGISLAPISITGDGLYTLSLTMMLGRILPLVVLWWAALTTRNAAEK